MDEEQEMRLFNFFFEFEREKETFFFVYCFEEYLVKRSIYPKKIIWCH